MRRTVALFAVALVALGIAELAYHRHLRQAALEVPVAGGEGGGLPVALPQDEHFQAGALEGVSADAAASGLAALVVMRDGHVVFARYGHGLSADSRVDSGGFTSVLVALLAGVAVQEGAVSINSLGRFDTNSWSAAVERALHASYPELLAHKLWAPLNGASAWISLPAAGAAVPTDCCFHARVQDWVRIGELLADGGRFEGTQIVDANWVAAMRQPNSPDGRSGLGVELAAAARGVEPFTVDDMLFLRGRGHWRLWVAPSLHLVVLFGDAAGGTSSTSSTVAGESVWDETRLPNLVTAAITNRSAPQNAGSLLQQLVPHH
jgi:CubicO group peptidase (beta-lactamase class C family)